MDDQIKLAEQFEAHRSRLEGVAYRMLGALSDAEDAVQESWLRLSRTDAGGIDNLGGWLTTVVSRICLDMLRARQARREEPLAGGLSDAPASDSDRRNDPEREALMAESVGLALLVVLGRLNPAERIAFVLHDIFALPFNEIAAIVEKSETAVRLLASRARRKVRGAAREPEADISRQRELIDAFLAAAYAGKLDTLMSLLDPNVVLRDDRQSSAAKITRGARALAEQVSGRASAAQSALVNGSVGVIAAPLGRLLFVIAFTIRNDVIAEVDLISDAERIRRLDLAVLDE